MSGDKKPFPFLKTPFDERDGQFSPDGKWIAYQSNESGRVEIVVQPFPGPGGKFQISTNGGAQPRWNKNSKEIFYVSLDSKMMAAPVKLSPDGQSLETGTPVALFPVRIAVGPVSEQISKHQYAASSDGQRFLVNLAADESAASSITVIYNWKPKSSLRGRTGRGTAVKNRFSRQVHRTTVTCLDSRLFGELTGERFGAEQTVDEILVCILKRHKISYQNHARPPGKIESDLRTLPCDLPRDATSCLLCDTG